MNAPIDLRDVVLHTPRLTLRPWRPDDLDDFYAYAREDGVGQMAGWLPHKNREETRKILDLFIGQHKTFALEYQGGVVGSWAWSATTRSTIPNWPLTGGGKSAMSWPNPAGAGA